MLPLTSAWLECPQAWAELSPRPPLTPPAPGRPSRRPPLTPPAPPHPWFLRPPGGAAACGGWSGHGAVRRPVGRAAGWAPHLLLRPAFLVGRLPLGGFPSAPAGWWGSGGGGRCREWSLAGCGCAGRGPASRGGCLGPGLERGLELEPEPSDTGLSPARGGLGPVPGRGLSALWRMEGSLTAASGMRAIGSPAAQHPHSSVLLPGSDERERHEEKGGKRELKWQFNRWRREEGSAAQAVVQHLPDGDAWAASER